MRLIVCLVFLLFATGANAAEVLTGVPRIIDGDTVVVNGQSIRLEGIDAPEAGQKCNKSSHGKWACGKQAIKALKQLIGNTTVHCHTQPKRDLYNRLIGTCYSKQVDLNAQMVKQGYAWAFVKYSRKYLSQETEARRAHKGIWQAQTETAWDYRSHRWHMAKQEAPDKACPIKGNISGKGKIYHTPWSPWYSRTRINLKKGERWFCTEDEALKAGWRAPQWG
ncbi:MAG: thermonuclease family protein [Methyloligellaceae bacterium]